MKQRQVEGMVTDPTGETAAGLPKWRQVLQSRKVWAGLLALVISGLLWWQGLIGAEQFSQAVVIVVGIFMGSVALEDGLSAVFLVWAAREREILRELRWTEEEEEALKRLRMS